MEEKRRKVILDVDTGNDDAVAIMAAVLSQKLDVLGITVVHGNLPLECTVKNTLKVVELLKAKVPVFAGCAYPLVKDLSPGRVVNSDEYRPKIYENGKLVSTHAASFDLPEPAIQTEKENAVVWLMDTLEHTEEKVTLILLGAMTNFATAVRLRPSIIDNIEEIYCMGGGVNVFNRSMRAETNFFNDPEAAKIVMACGAKVILVTLDATHSSWFGYEEADAFRKLCNPYGDFAAEMLEERIYAANKIGLRSEQKSALHDVLAVCAVIDSAILTDVRHEYCDVEIGGGMSDGMLLLSTRLKYSEPEKPTYVSYKEDGKNLFSMLYSYFSKGN